MHWPKKSEKKVKELEQLKQTIKTSPLKTKKSPKSLVGSDAINQKDYSSLKNYIKAYSDKEGEERYKKKQYWPENPLKPKPKEKR